MNLGDLIAVGAQEVGEADVRPDRYMRVVVEIFGRAIAVVGLEQIDRAPRAQLRAQGIEHGSEILLRHMLEEIAGEREIDRAVVERGHIRDRRHDALDPGRDVLTEIGP